MKLGRDTTVETIAKAQSGDREAMEQLIRENVSLCEVIASQNEVPGALYEDKVQECMIALHRAAQTFKTNGGAQWRTWANRILSNAMIDMKRSANGQNNRALRNTTDVDEHEEFIGDKSFDVEQMVDERVALDKLVRAAVAVSVYGVRKGSPGHVRVLVSYVRETLPTMYGAVVEACRTEAQQPSLFVVDFMGDRAPLNQVVADALKQFGYFQRLVLSDLANDYDMGEIAERLDVSFDLVKMTRDQLRADATDDPGDVRSA